MVVFVVGIAAGARAAVDTATITLEPDVPQAARGGQTGLDIILEIARGWHINAHRPNEPFLIPTNIVLTLPPGVAADPLTFPPPDKKTFAFAPGKQLLVYEGKVGITTALSVPADYQGQQLRIHAELRYQACNDTNCLPPTTAERELVLPISDTISPPAPTPAASGASAPGTTAPGATHFDVGLWMAQRGLAVTLGLVALLGLGLNLTPCVYPLISVTVAYFGSQTRQRSASVFGMAVLYVLGITTSFAVLGVAAALSGSLFGAALQEPLVLIGIAGVLVLLALSSFGLYQLQPPPWLLRRVGGSTPGAVGAFIMGVTIGIVAAPCVGPVVLGLLVFVGSQQRVSLGLELFFALGLGMGLPYLALGMAAGSIRALPRSGEWLMWIEHLFGIMLLALAAYFVTPLLPKVPGRLLLPALLAVGGLYLGFIDRSGRNVRYFPVMQRVTGIAGVLLAVWLAVPLRADSAIRWQPFENGALLSARTAGRPAIIDFVAAWCIPCHEMESTTFTDAAVRGEAERFAMFKADITRDSDETSALVDAYGVQGVPTVIFLDSSGTEVQRLVGYVGGDEMVTAMRAVR